MAQCKRDVTPVRQQWSYVSFASSHQNIDWGAIQQQWILDKLKFLFFKGPGQSHCKIHTASAVQGDCETVSCTPVVVDCRTGPLKIICDKNKRLKTCLPSNGEYTLTIALFQITTMGNRRHDFQPPHWPTDHIVNLNLAAWCNHRCHRSGSMLVQVMGPLNESNMILMG